MAQIPYPDKRYRAWILLQVEYSDDLVKAIIALDTGGDERIIIRVDGVQALQDGVFNLVVPVDADSDDELTNVVNDILAVAKPASHEVYEVIQEFPRPSHLADGFITLREAMDDPTIPGKIVKVGRQRNSPGENPWG